MKNLKLFVFALCAVLLSVVTVNAATTCNKPGESLTGVQTACAAAVDGVGYANVDDAWHKITDNGGEKIELYSNLTLSVARSFAKNVTIVGNGHVLELTGNAQLTVTKGTLTIQDVTYKSAKDIVVQKEGNLILNNVAADLTNSYVTNAGSTTVTGGSVKLDDQSHSVFINAQGGNLVLNDLKNVVAKKSELVSVTHHQGTITINSGTYYVKSLLALGTLSAPAAADEENNKEAEKAAKVVINNGTVNAENTAMELDKGIIVMVNNGTITAKNGYVAYVKTADLEVKGGTLTSNTTDVIHTSSAATKGSLKISGGKLVAAKDAGHALALNSTKLTYAISGGILESQGEKKNAAIVISTNSATVTDKDGKVALAPAYTGILTGGKYLNNIYVGVVTDTAGGTYDVSNQLVAEGYTVKTEDPYKVVVSTKASEETSKPGAKPGEEAPNTFDAGLTYVGLALSAVGASIVSARKLRNN